MTEPTVPTGAAAKALGIGKVTLLRWMRAGHVHPAWTTPAGQHRWNLADLHRQLAVSPAEEQPVAVPAHDPTAPIKPPVAAAIVTSKLGVLVERRRDGRPLWTFPAGEIEPGESPADTAIRETKEECGLAIVVSHIIGERDHPKTGTHMIYLAARPWHGTEVHNGDEDELAEVRWATLAEAERLLAGMYVPVHDHLIETIGHCPDWTVDGPGPPQHP